MFIVKLDDDSVYGSCIDTGCDHDFVYIVYISQTVTLSPTIK